MQRRLIPEVLQGLIGERLKLQEARKLKLGTTDQEVRQAVDTIEAENGMQPGSFRKLMAERHIDPETLYSQVEADLAWMKVVREDLRQTITVAPEEVKAVMAKLKASQGKSENEISEIYLPVNVNARDADVRQLADRLVHQARGGTPFAALAQQFSQSPTAAKQGDLGWVHKGELEDEIDAAVARMEPGEISDPVRTNTGYHIIQLRARRLSGTADPLMAIVTLSQIYLPTLGGHALPPARLAELSDQIETQIANCDQMNQWAGRVGGPGSGPIDLMRIGGLPDAVRDAVVKLQPNHISAPIAVKGARLFVMVCTRKDDSGLPSEEQVYMKLENDKLENAAEQRLLDLQRQALIDVRLY
jgi:peptidyl-prolyl cis-trans isomerase SurA